MRRLRLSILGFRFEPSYFFIVLTALSVCMLIQLGVWQLHRAAQKKEMLQQSTSFAKLAPIDWESAAALPMQYQSIQVKGRYLASIFLLDNQHQNHQFGYDILSPLVLADGSIVMVDRGFVVADATRQTFPTVVIPKKPLSITGSVYFPSKKQWVLGPSFEVKSADITIVEQISAKIFSQILQKKVYPFIIRLNKTEPYGFIRNFTIIAMPAERHFAYALQWFAMAFVVLVLFIALNVTRGISKR
jgi:surfeit locus 1 family protein